MSLENIHSSANIALDGTIEKDSDHVDPRISNSSNANANSTNSDKNYISKRKTNKIIGSTSKNINKINLTKSPSLDNIVSTCNKELSPSKSASPQIQIANFGITSHNVFSINQEHLQCVQCEKNTMETNLYLLPCYHTICFSCVIIQEGYFKCPLANCVSVTSMEYGELRANMLAVDYKEVKEKANKFISNAATYTCQDNLSKVIHNNSQWNLTTCEQCFNTAQPQNAQVICFECNRLLCCVDQSLHDRNFDSEGVSHLVLTPQQIQETTIEELMSKLQTKPTKCLKHPVKRINHFCTEDNAFICDTCLLEDHRHHTTLSLPNHFQNLKKRFMQHIKSDYNSASSLSQKKQDLRIRLEENTNHENRLINEITQQFDEILQKVELTRNDLIHKLFAYYNKSKQEINFRIQQIEREISLLYRNNSYLTTCIKFCKVQTLQDHCTQLVNCKTSIYRLTDLKSKELPQIPHLKFKIANNLSDYISDNAKLISSKRYTDIRPDLIISNTIATGFKYLYGTDTDAENNLYVVDGGSKSVKVFKEGELKLSVDEKEHMCYPWDVCICNKNMFITDGNNHCVLKFNLDGSFVGKFGTQGSGNSQFNNPMGLSFLSSKKHLFVCDNDNNRIQTIDLDLEWVSTLFEGEILAPRDVSVMKDEWMIILDEGDPCLHLYDYKGKIIANYVGRGPGRNLTNPFFISIDDDCNVIVTDYGSNIVKVFSIDQGKFIYKLDNETLTGVELKSPNGVHFDKSGRIIIANCGNLQVMRFSFGKY